MKSVVKLGLKALQNLVAHAELNALQTTIFMQIEIILRYSNVNDIMKLFVSLHAFAEFSRNAERGTCGSAMKTSTLD